MSHDAARKRSAAEMAAVKKLEAIAKALPEVEQSRDGFGHTVFKVGRKSLVILGEDDDGRVSLAINLDKETQRFLMERFGFERTPYIGQHGWTSHTVSGATDWEQISELVHEAYRRVAPRRLVRLLPAEE